MIKIEFVQDGVFFEVKSTNAMVHTNSISVKINCKELEYKSLPRSSQKKLQYTVLPGNMWCEIPYEVGAPVSISSI